MLQRLVWLALVAAGLTVWWALGIGNARTFLPALLQGAVVTLQIAVLASVVAVVVALVAALGKLSRLRLVALARHRLHRVVPRHLGPGAALLAVLRAAVLRHHARAVHGGGARRSA